MPNENVPHSNQRIAEETSSVLEKCLLFILKNISVCSWIRWLHNHGSQGDDVTWATNYNLYIIQPTKISTIILINLFLLFPLHLFYCAFLIFNMEYNFIAGIPHFNACHFMYFTDSVFLTNWRFMAALCEEVHWHHFSKKQKQKQHLITLCLSVIFW